MSSCLKAAPAGTHPASGERPEVTQLSRDALEWPWMLSPELRGNFSGEKVLQSPALPSVRCFPREDEVAGCRKVRENRERQ